MDSSETERMYAIEPCVPLDTDPLLGDMGLENKQTPSSTYLVSNEGSKLKQYIGTLGVTLSAMSAGTTMAWTSSASTMKEPNSTDVEFPVSKDEFEWISACLALGAMIACLPVGSLVDILGRKKILLFMVPFMLLGWAAIIWPKSIWMLYLGRVLVGGVTGGFCIVTPMYVGEIAESSIRGVLGSFFQLQITIGILLVYILGAVTNVFWVSLVCGIIPIAFGAFTLFVPESPRWLLANGRKAEAQRALRFYRGDSYDVDREISDVETALEEEKMNKTSCTQAFSTTAAKKGLVLSLGVMLFQQFSGINAVIFYASDIFEAAGSSMKAKEATIIVGVCQVVFTVVGTFTIDRLGRKILLFSSGLVMSISSIVLGVYFFLKYNHNDVSNIGWLPLVCVNGFIILFSVGYGPIPWLYMAEIFNPQIKGQAASIATMTNWTCVFIITRFYGPVSVALGTHTTFWFFGGVSAAGCIFVLTLLLETKGKSLEQIQYELDPSASRSSQRTPSNKKQESNSAMENDTFSLPVPTD